MIVAVLMYMKNTRSPYELKTQTRVAPEDVIRTAVQTFTLAGWQVTSQTRDNATFVVNQKGSCLIACLLLLLGFIPGVLYLAFSGRSISANVYAHRSGGPATSVQINGTAQGFRGREPAEHVIRALSAGTVGAMRGTLP